MPRKKYNRFALWGFIAALMPFVPFLGLILCTKAWYDCDESGEGGRGLATAGLILGWIEFFAFAFVLAWLAYRFWAKQVF